MSAKKKADDLVDKFTFASIYFSDKKDGAYMNAIVCAMIAVDEILDNTPMYIGNLNPKWKFLNDVKLELENYKPT